MNYLRGAFADAKVKYRINKAVGDATSTPNPANYALCVELADEHPNTTLNAIKDRTTYSHPDTTYQALTLLEHLVGACNYGLHEALAQHTSLQDKIVQLAVRRAEDDAHRRVQRLCRLTLLEYSRMFADDKALQRLSRLGQLFEKRTHKNLLRCLNVQTRHVAFREVGVQDVVVLTPVDGLHTSVPVGVKDLAPLRFSKAEVWLCRVCGYMNSPAAGRCAACETVRATGNTPPSSPKGAATTTTTTAAASPSAERLPSMEGAATATGGTVRHAVGITTGVSPHRAGANDSGSVLLVGNVVESQRTEARFRDRADEDEDLAGEGTPVAMPPVYAASPSSSSSPESPLSVGGGGGAGAGPSPAPCKPSSFDVLLEQQLRIGGTTDSNATPGEGVGIGGEGKDRATATAQLKEKDEAEEEDLR